MNIRIAFLTLSLTLSAAIVYPQKQEAIQKGIVKTLGRANKKGMPLSGVDICGFGQQNSTYSKEDGTFSLSLPGKKIGDAYKLSKVYKEKYELIDKDVIGRSYAFSDKVHLTIVMASTKQLQEDKKRLEKSFYDMAQNNYNKELESLETERDKSASTTEEFKKRIAELEESFEQYQHMIKDIAEHYARIDYDSLNAMERECCQCIENGNLERAKSLLTMLVNLEKLEREKEELKRIEQDSIQAAKGLAQARTDSIEQRKMQEKHAEHLYQLYTIALTRFQNDSARFFIEQRALLDTTNVEWQNDAGLFCGTFLAEYEYALYYLQRALTHSITQFGEVSRWVSTIYNNIGYIFSEIGETEKSLKSYLIAKDIIEQLAENVQNDLGIILNNIGYQYQKLTNYTDALYYHRQAAILFGAGGKTSKESEDIAISYTLMGSAFSNLGDSVNALNYYKKAVDIFENTCGTTHPNTAKAYNYIGGAYKKRGKYKEAINYHLKAAEIFEQIYGYIHPAVAATYIYMGDICIAVGDTLNALDFYTMALEIRKIIFNFAHIDIATCYIKIGKVYRIQRKFQEALDNGFMALKIYESTPSEKERQQYIAAALNHIGYTYYAYGDNENALNYLSKALNLYESIYGIDENPVIITEKKLVEKLKKELSDKN